MRSSEGVYKVKLFCRQTLLNKHTVHGFQGHTCRAAVPFPLVMGKDTVHLNQVVTSDY